MTEATKELLKQVEQAMRENRLTDAKRDIVEAIGLLRQDGARADLAKVVRGLGEIERKLGNGEAARRHYEEAVGLLRELDDPLRLAHPEPPPGHLANAIRSMAVLKDDTGNLEQAMLLWSEARDLYAKLNCPPAVAETSARLALLAHRKGDIEQARQRLSEAKAAAEAVDDPTRFDTRAKPKPVSKVSRVLDVTIDGVRHYCLGLPHTTEDVKWENNLVFSIGKKMFAVVALEPGGTWLSFKCTPEELAELSERPGCRPAPYLARASWIALDHPDALDAQDVERLLSQSYELVFSKLTKKLQRELSS